MKKLFAITLVLIMALCLMAGCGDKESSIFDPNFMQQMAPNSNQQGVVQPNVDTPNSGNIPNLETFPQITAPQFTMPELTLPDLDIDMPDVQVPTTAPPQTESIPVPTLPVYDEPDYDEPSYDEPVYTTPDVEDVSPEPNYYLNDDNNYYNENAVAVNPRYVYWDTDGTLVAEVFVVNGYSYHVDAIMLDHFELSVNGQLIAAADFGELPDVNIPSHYYEIYTLTFGADDIVYPGADLYDLDWYYELRSHGAA